MSDPEAEADTEVADQLRSQGVPTIDIARRLRLSVCVVQRWFDLTDELSTDDPEGFPGLSDSYQNAQP